jgi:hypothetical protein
MALLARLRFVMLALTDTETQSSSPDRTPRHGRSWGRAWRGAPGLPGRSATGSGALGDTTRTSHAQGLWALVLNALEPQSD